MVEANLKVELDDIVRHDRIVDKKTLNVQYQDDVRKLLEGVRNCFISPYNVKWLKLGFNANITYEPTTGTFWLYCMNSREIVTITRRDCHDEILLQALEMLAACRFKIEYVQGYSKYDDKPFWKVTYIPPEEDF